MNGEGVTLQGMASMFELEPLTPRLGAVVRGVDLREELDATLVDALENALVEWKVLFFHDQPITTAQHVAFGRRFGELEVHPFAGHEEDHPEVMQLHHGSEPRSVGSYKENIWHTDVTWRECPSKASVLRARRVPAVGGDTIWVDMAAVLASLPSPMQEFLATLTATHDFVPSFGAVIPPDRLAAMREQFPVVEHPVVRTHPVSGERVLFVNESFTTSIVGFEREDGREFLRFLTSRAAQPDFQCRFHWRNNSIAVWDNRSTQHYAVQDYWPESRIMDRVTIRGERPV